MPAGTGILSGMQAETRNVWMRSANRGNGNNVANVNSTGNCNNNNAVNGYRVAPDRASDERKGWHAVQRTRNIGTRSLHPAGATREQGGGDGIVPRDGMPTSAPGYSPCVESVIGYDALWDSMMKCRCGVMWKGSAASFVLNGAESVSKLCDELHDGTYRPRPVSHFTVTSPKRREIVGISFRDRVYQRSLNDNAVYPVMSRSWIYDNYACQTGKGTDFARARLKCFYERFYREHGSDGWVLSADVKGYYPNMRHAAAEEMFERALPQWAFGMVFGVLRSQYPGDVGYNPGSQIVQIAGVSMLSGVDHHCKERLGCRHYGRYMDDFRVVHHDRAFLEDVRDELAVEVGKLGYELHPTKTRISRLSDRNRFLGFDFRLARSGKVVMTLAPESVKRMRRRTSGLWKLESMGARPPGTCDIAYESWRAHASKGDSRLLLERCDGWFADMKEETR